MCVNFFVQLQGMLRVILEPLIGQAPLVGGVTMFFIRRPVSTDIARNWQVQSKITKVSSSLAKHKHFKLYFQVLQINWTGMTNVLDGPGLRYAHRFELF